MPDEQRNKQYESWDSVDLEQSGHEGSAPMNLTGGGVVGAWMGSLLLHFFALGVMFLIVFPFSPNLADDDVSIANVQLVGEVDAIPLSPINMPDPPATREDATESRQVTPTATPEESVEDLIEPSSLKKPDYSVLGLRAASGDGSPWSGAAAPGGELGPDFFGLGGSARGARTVVYVVDHSGSMQAKLGLVKLELWRSISALRRSQKFHVIFFAGRMPTESPPKRFVNAIEVYKNEFREWLDDIPLGYRTNPNAALRRALSMKPDILFFLTDAEGSSFDDGLRKRLDEWNKDRRTRIFTVAYIERSGQRFLETVAREHGGECRFVSEDDLPD
jgi:Mg-chelatase subunit ChlD